MRARIMHFQKQFIRLHVSCNVFLFRYLAIWYLEFRYQIPDIQLSRYQGYPDLVQVSCYLPTPVPIGKVHDRRSTKSEHFVIIIVIRGAKTKNFPGSNFLRAKTFRTKCAKPFLTTSLKSALLPLATLPKNA